MFYFLLLYLVMHYYSHLYQLPRFMIIDKKMIEEHEKTKRATRDHLLCCDNEGF